ncbi:MAG TPA: MBL fold metallo-hydrolase [Clostridia bacterium]|nr:MBL fold metallo-hydrolase [Clostridia bacterium]
MEIKRIGGRGTLFTFYDLGLATNVYAIHGKQNIYIIDTYLGPDIMKQVNKYIEEVFGNKPVIVINSHSHWDHVWGNSQYSSTFIIAHEKCREYMLQDGLEKLEKYAKHQKGEVVLTYPNLTFTDRIFFEEDNILVYHTPGHTDDSISVLDMQDKVLFAGDNLERPIPFLMSRDLNRYINTLQDYLDTDASIILGGHTGCEGKSLALHNLDYVKRVFAGEIIEIESEEFAEYHKTNMDWLKG